MDKLYNYLLATKLDGETVYQRYERFGRALGVTMYCVRKWAAGQRRVPDDVKVQIEEITDGKVTIEDLVRG